MSKQNFDRLVPLVFLFCDEDSQGRLPLKLLDDYCVETDVYTDPARFAKDVQRLRPDICMLLLRPGGEQALKERIAGIRHNPDFDTPIAVLADASQEGFATLANITGVEEVLALPATAATVAACLAPYIKNSALTKAIAQYGINATKKNKAVVVDAPAEVAAAPSTEPAAVPVAESVAEPIAEPIAAPAKHESPSVSPLVDWLFLKILSPLNGLEDVLEDLDSAEAQIDFYLKKLMPHKDDFIRMIKAMRRSESEPDFTQCLRLYGVSASRKLLVAQRLLEVTGGKPLKWDPSSGRLAVDPKTVIPCASQMAEHFDEGSAYRQIAFNCGLVLDVLLHASSFAPDRKSAIKNLIETSVRVIQTKTDLGMKKAKEVSNLAYGKHILTALTMKEAGRIAMSIYLKDYMPRRARLEKKEIPLALQQILENRHYSISHNIVGALICQNTPGLGIAHKAVLFCNTPVILKSVSTELNSHTLAALCQSL